ncbi:unnamed protein product [Spirodela intermedia]|uniref:Signal peptidase complex subunit 2 n=1 Tax=Spirodela intermedia TaxID=51605 RepID=A0A7I8IK54_SPIIN|nr:unnamed protein product [Spirodela intermedia]CAA6658231.1 unnamed protein product [Spirodela intermedia]
MASKNSGTQGKSPKKVNLLDQNAIKNLLDESITEKFPENKDFLFYVVLSALLQVITYTKEKNAILFTHPPPGSFHTTGLIVSSKLPRFSDMLTLTVASADPKSVASNKPVQLTKSVTEWLVHQGGILVEGLFSKDVERLIDDYAADRKRK